MTVALNANAGRIGPGFPVQVTWDFVGPHSPGTTASIFLHRTSTGQALFDHTMLFPTNSVFGRLGTSDGTNFYGSYQSAGAVDNEALTIHVHIAEADGTILDTITYTNFTWDAQSAMWTLMGQWTHFGFGFGNAQALILDEIKAAVKHTY